jgi:two-component system, OmpR family, sensor histidine kinase CiaH
LFNKARWRLTLWFAAAFAIILLLIGGAVYFTARQSLMSQVRTDLQRQSDAVLAAQPQSDDLGGPPRFNVDQAAIRRVLSASGSFSVVVNDAGNVVDYSPNLVVDNLSLPSVSDLAKEAIGNKTIYAEASTSEGEQLRVVARAVTIRNSNGVVTGTGYLEIGRSIQAELHALRRLLVILFGGGLIGLVLAAAGGYWLAGRALKPIRATMDAQRAFVADASHELRTPLSLIRANAEMMQRHPEQPPDKAFVDDIISETDRLAYLVSQLLTLARSDAADAPFEKTPLDVNHLATDVTRQMQLLAGERQIALNFQPDGAANVYGDEQRLGELLLILLDNSVKYTNAGGAVDVSVGHANGRVQIAVTDNGVGIPKEAIPHVFDRFYRVDKARSREMGGSGLGLAIARWIAEKHDGRISLDSEPGKGTKVTVDLPAA